MTIIVNSVEYTLPDRLDMIPLSQHIEYMATYGTAYTQERDATVTKPSGKWLDPTAQDDGEKQLDLMLNHMDRAYASIAFYSGCDIEELKEYAEAADVLAAYAITQIVLADEQRDVVVEEEYTWLEDHDVPMTWQIVAPFKPDDMEGLSYANYKILSQFARDIVKFSEGDWSGVQRLCAAYFRRSGEDFDASMITGARYDMMADLPMDKVLAVLTFIEATMEIHVSNLGTYIAAQTGDIDDGEDGYIEPIPEP